MTFKLITDVTQQLKQELFGPGWLILAVASIPLSNISSERFFFLLLNTKTGESFIEEYMDSPRFFIKIEDNSLWNDLFRFFYEKGLITISKNKEIKSAKKK